MMMPRMMQIFMTSDPLQLQVVVSATVGCTAASKIELIELIKFSAPVVTNLNTKRIIEGYRETAILPSLLRMIAVDYR